MIIYLSMMVWIIIVGSLSGVYEEFDPLAEGYEMRTSRTAMFMTMMYIVFFIGLRSAGADTHAYISSFRRVPTGFDAAVAAFVEGFTSGTKSPLFDSLEIIVKTFFGSSYHVWLFLVALVSGMAVASTLRRHTEYFTDAMLLFMLMGMYSWMINGIRQFVAVSLSFAAVDRLVRREWMIYIPIILLLATIHKSAIVMIPIYFIVSGEAWNKKTLLLILAGIFAVLFSGYTTGIWGDVMTSAGYSMDTYKTDDGSNFIRTLIFATPPLIAFMFRNNFTEEPSPLINVCINMSLVTVALSMVANVTSGVLVGRMPIYFSIYNLILLPWLVNHLPSVSLQQMVYISMYASYFALSLVEGYGYYYSDILFGGKIFY